MSQQRAWSYASEWLVVDRVCLVDIAGEYDEDAIIELNTYIRDTYLEQGIAPVHIVMRADDLDSYPRRLSVLRKATAISVQHPNTGWVFLVGFDNALLRFMSSTVAQLFRLNFKQLSTVEEACEVLNSLEPGLVAKT